MGMVLSKEMGYDTSGVSHKVRGRVEKGGGGDPVGCSWIHPNTCAGMGELHADAGVWHTYYGGWWEPHRTAMGTTT